MTARNKRNPEEAFPSLNTAPLLAPDATRKMHDDAVVALDILEISSRIFLASTARTASIRLWDPRDLAPIATLFGDEDPQPTRFFAVSEHLRTLHRAMDEPFAVAAQRLIPTAQQQDTVVSPSSSEHPEEGEQSLRRACLEQVVTNSVVEDDELARLGDTVLGEEADYENYAAELAHTLSARLCYRLRASDVLTEMILSSATPSHRPLSAKARRQKTLEKFGTRGHHTPTSARPSSARSTELLLPNGDAVGSFSSSQLSSSKSEIIPTAPKLTEMMAPALAKAARLHERVEAIANEDDSRKRRSDTSSTKSKAKPRVAAKEVKSVLKKPALRELSPHFVKQYGRFGPYDVSIVLACSRFFRELDSEDIGKLDVDVLRSRVDTERDPQTRALLNGLVAFASGRSTLELSDLLHLVLCRAAKDDIKRAIATLDVLAMISRLRAPFRDLVHHPRLLRLSQPIRAEIDAVFANATATVSLRDLPALLVEADFLPHNEDADADKLAGALAIDKDLELDARQFAAALLTLLVAQRRRTRPLLSPATTASCRGGGAGNLFSDGLARRQQQVRLLVKGPALAKARLAKSRRAEPSLAALQQQTPPLTPLSVPP